MALQLEAEMELADGEMGRAIAYVRASRRQLQSRTSIRETGLPPLDGDGGLYKQHLQLALLINKKQEALEEMEMAWSKENDSIYFAPIPTEETVLNLELPQALIMSVAAYDANTRLGSVRMFHEISEVVDEADLVTNMEGCAIDDTASEDPEGNDDVSDGEADAIEEIQMHQSRINTDDRYDDDGMTDSGQSIGSSISETDVPALVIVAPGEEQTAPTADLVPPHKHAKSFDYRPPEASAATESMKRTVAQLTRNASSTRRMATRVQPQKSMTSRKLLGDIGKADSLVVLQQHEKLLRKVVTEESVFRMKRTMLGGVEVYRLVKDTWKKEILRVHDDHIVRKKAIAILSKQLKIPWATVHAFQHELQPTNQVLQLLAAPGRRMTSILIIAGRGDQVGPNELTFTTPEENAVAVASLQRFLQEKRVGGASIRGR